MILNITVVVTILAQLPVLSLLLPGKLTITMINIMTSMLFVAVEVPHIQLLQNFRAGFLNFCH